MTLALERTSDSIVGTVLALLMNDDQCIVHSLV